jgi:hypothetical protein
VDGATVGLAGATQIFRIDRKVDICRKGRVIKTTLLAFYGVTSLWTNEANPQQLLELVRGYWAIETKQHYRRDHTQREDHCLVRNPVAARNLSRMRSAAPSRRRTIAARLATKEYPQSQCTDPTVGPSHRLKGDLGFPNDRLTCQVARAQGSCPLL